jgi:hypothetical protein
MLPRLVQLRVQGFGVEDRVTIPLQKIGLLILSLHQALRKTQQLISTQYSEASELKVLIAYLDPVLRLAP